MTAVKINTCGYITMKGRQMHNQPKMSFQIITLALSVTALFIISSDALASKKKGIEETKAHSIFKHQFIKNIVEFESEHSNPPIVVVDLFGGKIIYDDGESVEIGTAGRIISKVPVLSYFINDIQYEEKNDCKIRDAAIGGTTLYVSNFNFGQKEPSYADIDDQDVNLQNLSVPADQELQTHLISNISNYMDRVSDILANYMMVGINIKPSI